MHLEDELIKIYFQSMSVDMILNGKIDCRRFPQKEFEELLFCYMKEYSETECAMLYQSMVGSSYTVEIDNCLNVFSVLEKASDQMLVLLDNEIKCQYSSLERWRNLARCIGEDLLVCAFAVRQSRKSGKIWEFFQWNVVLGHTNYQLNTIMKRGISENHFHLFGSAPVFPLLWLKLMNDIHMNRYVVAFREIDRKRRNKNYHFDSAYGEESIECMVLQAAFIRAVLYVYVNGMEENERYRKKIEWLLPYLNKGEQIRDVQMEIRELINLLKAERALLKGKELPDYAVIGIEEDNINWIFAGERKLIYKALYVVLIKRNATDRFMQLLYSYLVIRTCLRGEIIQNNFNIGLENFLVYQKRKGNLLTDYKDKVLMVKHAVHSSFCLENLRSLEIRITPGKTYLENAKTLLTYDKIICSQGKINKEDFYYVYHFAKERDAYKSQIEEEPIPCRDAVVRKSIKMQGNGILELRKRMPAEASRVRGIDACSQEIGCRPEVFAPTFRRLQNHITSFLSTDPVKQLRQTYHVGEDFLDLTDGLRALDEAICFLNMRNGDRLGHATALGISARKWYERKHFKIIISMQDYLDNLMWFYHKILEFQIPECEQLKEWLCHQFDDYFFRLYVQNGDREIKSDIYMYYEAWKLRGDEPELYRKGFFDSSLTLISDGTGINREFPKHCYVREEGDVTHLYWLYHYCRGVREKGHQIVEVQIPELYVAGIEKLQKEMQRMIGDKGIGIEVNPSSNLAISSMDNYGEHPILNMYDIGLRENKEDECFQLCVSINTDDKGIFHTTLENEYALVASALENMVDANGKKCYNKQYVYEWLDRIRIMGNQQKF